MTAKQLIPLAWLAAALAGGCGGAGTSARTGSRPPKPLPPSWHALRIPSGAVLFYPPGWHEARGDSGTATAVATDAGGAIVGYLNLTPRQGGETPANWASFRLRHNEAEGERDVRREAIGARLPVRAGSGTCVRDSYTTVTSAR